MTLTETFTITCIASFNSHNGTVKGTVAGTPSLLAIRLSTGSKSQGWEVAEWSLEPGSSRPKAVFGTTMHNRPLIRQHGWHM